MMASVPHFLDADLRALLGNERLLWCGTPDPRRLWPTALKRALPGLFFVAFVLLQPLRWQPTRAGVEVDPFTLVFVTLVFCAFAFASLKDALRGFRTCYAVTPTRALVVSRLWSPAYEIFDLGNGRRFDRVPRDDNQGDIVFEWRKEGRACTRPVGFVALRDFAGADQALQEASAGTVAPETPVVLPGGPVGTVTSADIPVPPAPLAAAMHAELRGEPLLLGGLPDDERAGHRYLRAGLFGFVFMVFAIFWTCIATFGAYQEGKSNVLAWLFPLPGLGFVAIGVRMFLSPWFAERAARRTYYAVTPTRALVIVGSRQVRVRTFDLARCPGIECVSSGTRWADILFEAPGAPAPGARRDGFVDLVDWSRAAIALRLAMARSRAMDGA